MGDPKNPTIEEVEQLAQADEAAIPQKFTRAPAPLKPVGGRSVWIRPQIQTLPSKPLAYMFPFPEALASRVRAEMLRADGDFAQVERSHNLSCRERRALAVRWICRIVAVFARNACELVRAGAPEWSPSQIEPRVNEVIRLLALEAEYSKFAGGDKPHLIKGWAVSDEALAEIAGASEWSTYQKEFLEVIDASAGNRSAKSVSKKLIQAGSDGGPDARDRLVAGRKKLLEEYKRATGDPANKKIYEARNSNIHKPQFYRWANGKLASDSATTINFERFLREKRRPVPKVAQS